MSTAVETQSCRALLVSAPASGPLGNAVDVDALPVVAFARPSAEPIEEPLLRTGSCVHFYFASNPVATARMFAP